MRICLHWFHMTRTSVEGINLCRDNIYRSDDFGWHVYYLSWIYDQRQREKRDMASWQWTIRCHSSSADLTIGQTPLTRANRMACQCNDHHIIKSWPCSTKRESYVWGSKTGIMSSRSEREPGVFTNVASAAPVWPTLWRKLRYYYYCYLYSGSFVKPATEEE